MISKEWTLEERLHLINEISAYPLNHQQEVSRVNLFHDLERINLLAYQTPAFLEQNREQIIGGVQP